MVNSRTISSSRLFTSMLTLIAGVAILYLAQDVWVPVVLAVLLTFLLGPMVTRLQPLIRSRVLAVALVSLVTFSILGGIGMFMGSQLRGMIGQLPQYRETVLKKIRSARTTSIDGPLSRAGKTIEDISNEITTSQPAGSTREIPSMPVKPADNTWGLWSYIPSVVPSLASTLGTAGIICLLVIMMLLSREDIRDRVLLLAGDYNLSFSTQALDEAGTRISRYLLMQLLINIFFGVTTGTGLYFIGLPSAPLWGLFATLLRFVPFIGPWIAASFPLLLSIAVFDDWSHLAMVACLFVCVELFTNLVLEPWLYGSSTGISPFGVVITVIFWTWLWGPIGMLLAVPMTVCILVIAKYVPGLEPVTILLADKSPLPPEGRLYQRLLSGDENEVEKQLEQAGKSAGYLEICDQLLLPALGLARRDQNRGLLGPQQVHELCELLRGVAADVLAPVCAAPFDKPNLTMLGLMPTQGEIDETAAALLVPLIQAQGMGVVVSSHQSLTGEIADNLANHAVSIVCISAVLPTSRVRLRRLCAAIRQRLPDAHLLVGTWTDSNTPSTMIAKLSIQLSNVRVVPQFTSAIASICEFAMAKDQKTSAA